MNDKGLLLVISGPSGAGKGTVCKSYIEKHPECALSVSATTRAPRPGEVEGVNYYFMSQDDFRTKISNDGFLEHAVFCDNYYGTPKDAVMEMIESGRDVILEIEVQGAMQVRSHYPEAVLIFVSPPTEQELEDRLRKRGTETEEVILSRLKRAKEELRYTEKYNYVLINDTVENAVSHLEAITVAEKCRIERKYDFIMNAYKN